MENKIYLVSYYGGSYEDFYQKIVFATNNKKIATKYVTKFNRILKKWQTYYKQFEFTEYGIEWIKDEYIDLYFNRWDKLKDITKCYYEEIEVR